MRTVKRLGWLLFITVVVVALCYVGQYQSRVMTELVAELDRGVPSWESGRFSAIRHEVATNYRAATAALASNDFGRAYALAYYGGRNLLHPWLSPYGAKQVLPGVTMKDYAASLHGEYRQALLTALERAIGQVKTGDLSLDVLRDVVAWHDDIPEVKQRYEDEQRAIEEARLEAAHHWVRVTVMSDLDPVRVRSMVEQAMREKFVEAPDLKLVFGHSTGTEEDEATFRVVEVRVEAAYASVQVTRPPRTGWQPPEIPAACVIRFSTRAGKGETSWDALPSVSLSKMVPPKLSADQALALRDRRAVELVDGIRKALGGLPAFRLVPEAAAAAGLASSG